MTQPWIQQSEKAKKLGIIGFDPMEELLCPYIGLDGCCKTFYKCKFASDSKSRIENIHKLRTRKGKLKSFYNIGNRQRSRRLGKIFEIACLRKDMDWKCFLESVVRECNKKLLFLESEIKYDILEFPKEKTEESEEFESEEESIEEEEGEVESGEDLGELDGEIYEEKAKEKFDFTLPLSFDLTFAERQKERDILLVKFLESNYHSSSKVIRTIKLIANGNHVFKTFNSMLLRKKRVRKTLDFFNKRNITFNGKFASTMLKNSLISSSLKAATKFISDYKILIMWYDNCDISIPHADNRVMREQKRLIMQKKIKIVKYRSRRHLKTGSRMLVIPIISNPVIPELWKNKGGVIEQNAAELLEKIINLDKSVYEDEFEEFIISMLSNNPQSYLPERKKRVSVGAIYEIPLDENIVRDGFLEYIKESRIFMLSNDSLGCDCRIDFERIEKNTSLEFDKCTFLYLGMKKFIAIVGIDKNLVLLLLFILFRNWLGE